MSRHTIEFADDCGSGLVVVTRNIDDRLSNHVAERWVRHGVRGRNLIGLSVGGEVIWRGGEVIMGADRGVGEEHTGGRHRVGASVGVVVC